MGDLPVRKQFCGCSVGGVNSYGRFRVIGRGGGEEEEGEKERERMRYSTRHKTTRKLPTLLYLS